MITKFFRKQGQKLLCQYAKKVIEEKAETKNDKEDVKVTVSAEVLLDKEAPSIDEKSLL